MPDPTPNATAGPASANAQLALIDALSAYAQPYQAWIPDAIVQDIAAVRAYAVDQKARFEAIIGGKP